MDTTRPLTPVPAGDKPGLTDKQRQTIGASALLLCLLIGGGVIWWFFYGSAPTQRQVKVDPSEQSRGQIENRGMRSMREPRMITRLDPTTWLVHGNVGQMRVQQKGEALELSQFTYPGGLKLSDEQATLLSSRWRILHDPSMAKAWGITPEQRDKLDKIKPVSANSGGFDPTPDQRASLQSAFADYRKSADGAARSDAQKKVLDLIDSIARGTFDTNHAGYVDRAEQIRQMLTAEQLKKILKK